MLFRSAEEFAQELSEASEEVDKHWQEEGFEEIVKEGEGTLVYFSTDSTSNGECVEVPHIIEGVIPDSDIDALSSREKKRYFSLYEYSRTRPEKALEIVEGLLEKYPEVPSFLNCLYDIYRVLDRRQDAIEVLKEIVDRFPDYLLGKIEFASYLLRRGEPERVAELFAHAFTLSRLCPDRKFFYVVEWFRFMHVIGCYFVQVGMIDQAKQYLGVLQQHAKHSEEYEDLKTKIHNELLLNSLDNELQNLE